MRHCLQNKSGAFKIVSWRENEAVCIIDEKIKMKESLAQKKVINSPKKLSQKGIVESLQNNITKGKQ